MRTAFETWAQATVILLSAIGMAGTTCLQTGCGFPQYAVTPSKAENGVSFERSGLSDAKLEARIGSDTDCTIDGLDIKTSNGSTGHVDKVVYTSKPSSSLAAQVAAMQVYDQQLKSYYTGLADVATANWAGFTSAITAAAPIAGPYLGALGQAKLAKAQQPALVSQLADLTLAGKVNSASLENLGADPLIIAEVDRLVQARLKELLPAATQPAPKTVSHEEDVAPPVNPGGG